MERQISFQVLGYEAPLDLILSLIAQHKLDILHIDISALLEQYLAVITTWREQDLEIASAFLEMASRLVYMKTVSLLPRHEEESEKLRQELTGQLVEYRLCKIAAAQLGAWDISASLFTRPPARLPADLTYTFVHPAEDLLEALMAVQGKNARRLPPPRESFDPIIARPEVSITAKIFSVLRRLRKTRRVPFLGLFEPAQGRSGMVATFLAVLELTKSGKIVFRGTQVSLAGQGKSAQSRRISIG